MRRADSADGSTLKPGINPVPHPAARLTMLVTALLLLLFASEAVAQTSNAQKSRPSGKTAARKNSESSARSNSALDSRLNHLLQKQLETDESRQTAGSAANKSVRRSTFRPEASGDSNVSTASPLRPTPNLQPTSAVAASDEPQSETDAEPASVRQASFTPETSADAATIATPIDATEGVVAATASPTGASLFLDLRGEVAATSTDPTPGDGRKAEVSVETSPMQVLTRAVAWIVIALCLFSLAALGVRRWQRHRGLLPTSSTRSRVIETLSLGPGRSVSLIEMAGHRALVAFDASGIKQLVLTPPSFHDEFTEADEALTYEPPSRIKAETEGGQRKAESRLSPPNAHSLTTDH